MSHLKRVNWTAHFGHNSQPKQIIKILFWPGLDPWHGLHQFISRSISNNPFCGSSGLSLSISDRWSLTLTSGLLLGMCDKWPLSLTSWLCMCVSGWWPSTSELTLCFVSISWLGNVPSRNSSLCGLCMSSSELSNPVWVLEPAGWTVDWLGKSSFVTVVEYSLLDPFSGKQCTVCSLNKCNAIVPAKALYELNILVFPLVTGLDLPIGLGVHLFLYTM